MVGSVRRSLYGLKQAPRALFEHFVSMVTAAGFSASAHDPMLFVHPTFRGRTILLYVDDMIITGDDSEYIAFVKARRSEQFLMFDLGPLRYFLWIEVSSASNGSQKRSIFTILLLVLLLLMSAFEASMELNVHLRASDGDPLFDLMRCRYLVESLVYLAVTHLDISSSHVYLAVTHLDISSSHSHFESVCLCSTLVHYWHLLCVSQYLCGTLSHYLFFLPSSSFHL